MTPECEIKAQLEAAECEKGSLSCIMRKAHGVIERQYLKYNYERQHRIFKCKYCT
jgi:hypothetical protein